MGNHSHSHHHHTSLSMAPPHSETPEELQRYQETKKVTIVGALVNVVLAVLKIMIGYIGHSQSLVADGVHSLSDTATDIAILIGVRFWSAPPPATTCSSRALPSILEATDETLQFRWITIRFRSISKSYNQGDCCNEEGY